MSQTTDHTQGDQVAAETSYDIVATEKKWQPVWEDLQPFRADDDSPPPDRMPGGIPFIVGNEAAERFSF